jgi:glycosyltransferase involved in cell wall biosynthesis
MYHLKHPQGKVVCFEEKEDCEKYLKLGFTVMNDDEVEKYKEERIMLIESVKYHREPVQVVDDGWKRGVYFVSVNQEGKDGYGTSSERVFGNLKDIGVNISRSLDSQKLALVYHNPYTTLQVSAPIKILFTMFESTKIPNDWIDVLKSIDKIIVPSTWCQKVFADSGIETTVVPLGYDDKVYSYIPRYVKDRRKTPFVFLHYNAFNIRKGFPEVFKAFVQEFDKGEPVKLILKTVLNDPPIPINTDRYPNIEIICEKYSGDKMMELLGRSDCFVFPSRGEGFGMTPLEAMATGIPAIVPNAHGISEYFNSGMMYEVKVEAECPAIYARYKGQDVGKMVVCDVDDLRKKMRYVYEHPEEAIEKGRAASSYVQQWTLQKTAVRLKEIIDEMYQMKVEGKPNKNVLKLELV